jgi:hypothetical protein
MDNIIVATDKRGKTKYVKDHVSLTKDIREALVLHDEVSACYRMESFIRTNPQIKGKTYSIYWRYQI